MKPPKIQNTSQAQSEMHRDFVVIESEPALSTPNNEDPCIAHIREALRQYQNQSPAHFELRLEVYQIEDATRKVSIKLKPFTWVEVILRGAHVNGRVSVRAECRVQVRKRRSKLNPYVHITVSQSTRKVAIEKFVSSVFPVFDAPLREDTLWYWWQSTGKIFNWVGLPTELKQRIIEFCMHQQPLTQGVYNQKLLHFSQRHSLAYVTRKPAALEIIEQLGDSFQLLYVSHQVRAITLRLCIAGGSGLTHSAGLCIAASSYKDFAESFNRLGDYYQMVEPSSVPKNSQEAALAKCYTRFPRIYPDFNRFATLRHGIRKISLSMDFLPFMRFFEVEIGGFQKHRSRRGLTYHAFDRLPHLNEIVLILPGRPHSGWRHNPYCGGPQLFHDEDPCPRRLHRVIYERIAVLLAWHSKLTVRNFVDGEEEQRFAEQRVEAVHALNFTEDDLHELYADDGGGIELPEGTESVFGSAVVKQEPGAEERFASIEDNFFPPLCYCDEPCTLKLS
ncbi:hypothetical protein E8E13_000866 [Curvularia kusanoi]|uniref:Uncharacterized protein n=1 Tax=Curvularia kusanoi TaxID=90978 RepID=A0A9P4TEN1_CURKU|nr:hypothetical protein E8E13_000866 [Curvularia kusanoi]